MRAMRVLRWEDADGNTCVGIARDNWVKGYPIPEHAVVDHEGEVVWVRHREGDLISPFLGSPEQLEWVLRDAP